MNGEIFWIIGEGGRIAPSLILEALSPLERPKWERMHIPKRADEWLLGRWTAKKLLTSPGLPWEGQSFDSLTIENAPEGAPYVAGTDVPGCISLSHRAEMAAAAYFDLAGCAVGIDLELVEPRAENFIQDFFTETETEYALNLKGEARDEWVTLAWSAKEAVLKAWQKGLRVDTRAVELIPGEGQPGQNGWTHLSYRSNREDFPACWLGWRRVEGYILTLAYTLDKIEGEVEIRQVGG